MNNCSKYLNSEVNFMIGVRQVSKAARETEKLVASQHEYDSC